MLVDDKTFFPKGLRGFQFKASSNRPPLPFPLSFREGERRLFLGDFLSESFVVGRHFPLTGPPRCFAYRIMFSFVFLFHFFSSRDVDAGTPPFFLSGANRGAFFFPLSFSVRKCYTCASSFLCAPPGCATLVRRANRDEGLLSPPPSLSASYDYFSFVLPLFTLPSAANISRSVYLKLVLPSRLFLLTPCLSSRGSHLSRIPSPLYSPFPPDIAGIPPSTFLSDEPNSV